MSPHVKLQDCVSVCVCVCVCVYEWEKGGTLVPTGYVFASFLLLFFAPQVLTRTWAELLLLGCSGASSSGTEGWWPAAFWLGDTTWMLVAGPPSRRLLNIEHPAQQLMNTWGHYLPVLPPAQTVVWCQLLSTANFHEGERLWVCIIPRHVLPSIKSWNQREFIKGWESN